MKKLLFIAALLLSSAVIAKEYKYEITPVVGYNIAEGNLNLENQLLYGAEFQLNTDTFLKPELSVLFTDADYEDLPVNPSTDIWRFAVNGVHDFDAIGAFTPLFKVGIGYETIDNHLADNKDALFFNAGAGVKTLITNNIALKLEAVYMNKQTDSNLAFLAGLNFAFGSKSQPAPVDGDDDNDGVLNSIDQCPTTPTGTKVDSSGCKVDGDDDNDGVLNSIDQCPTTPAGTKVDSSGCKVDGDDDNDGVLNSVDQCPTTPAGTKVDSSGCKVDGDDDNDGVLNSLDRCPTTPAGNVVNSDGCELIMNLHINFENNSYEVDADSLVRVQKFAKFLIDFPNYTAQITGHTNSIGREATNQKLSENRASAVRDLIIKQGVDASRITAVGKGENSPVASNDTAEGLAQNRRIEATLNKN